VDRQLKRAKKKAAGQAAAAQRRWRLTELMRRVVLICFSLADGVVDPAVVYLQQQGRVYHWGDKTDDEVALMVNDEILAVDSDHLVVLCDIDAPSDALAMSTAVRFVEEWRAVTWAVGVNRKGVSPSTGALLDHIEERRADVPEHVRPQAWGTVASGAARMRAARLRRRWGGRMGVLRVQEVVPVEIMREKALRDRANTPPDLLVLSDAMCRCVCVCVCACRQVCRYTGK